MPPESIPLFQHSTPRTSTLRRKSSAQWRIKHFPSRRFNQFFIADYNIIRRTFCNLVARVQVLTFYLLDNRFIFLCAAFEKIPKAVRVTEFEQLNHIALDQIHFSNGGLPTDKRGGQQPTKI
jgi:hypothetical protein